MSYNSPFTDNVIQPTSVSYREITLTANLQLAWSISATEDDAAARIMEVTTTSYQLWMPPANQASVGQDALIRNIGGSNLEVYDFDGQNIIVTVAPGEAQYIYITENADEAGVWGIIAFGIGSSGADAATLAGYGLLAIGQTLNQAQPVSTFGINHTLNDTDRAGIHVWTGGSGTLTLPLASTLGNDWFTSLRNAGTGSLSVACSGGNTIDGSATLTMQPTDSAIVVCSGATFYTVGLGRSTQFAFTQLTKAVTSGTYTLTAAEASNVILKFTGTLAGNVTIEVPPTVQVYYVQNATDGTVSNYTVTLTTNTGGSDATISANQQSTLICDSSNLINANTVLAGSTSIGLIDGTVSSPALYFGSEPTTGIYRAGSGEFNTAILGVNRSTLTATGLTISGTGTFTDGISGGTF